MERCLVKSISLAYTRTGEGHPLLMLHGYPLDHSIWAPVVPLLQNSFELILPDLRGFGESDAPSEAYSLGDMAADLAGLLDHLEIERAALAGHSMGGYVALAFARLYPHRISGLALVASHPYADPPDRQEARLVTARAVAQQGVAVVADSMPEKLTTDLSLQRDLRNLALRQPPAGMIGALKAMAARSDSMDLLRGFDLPLVVVQGARDSIIPIQFGRDVQAALPAAQVVELANVGHMPMMEAPQETADALLRLLQQ